MAGEKYITLERDQVIVESLDALKVEVVGGRVEDKTVGVLQLHSRNHATHLLASGEHIDFLLDFFLTEKHTTQVGFHRHLIASTVLAEPVDKIQI